MSAQLPLIMTAAGPQATPVTTLQQTLIADVAAISPDYTANLPGSLIEDVSSTDVAAMAMIDQARVDAVNSVTPYGANASILAQLGVMFGLPQGAPTNATVQVVFSGSAGYVLPPGFIVSDGTNQYALADGGVIQSSGTSAQLTAVATSFGTFSIPASTVTTIVTSVPSGYTLTVTNPQAGIPATSAESVSSYRARIIGAFSVTSTGTPAAVMTALTALTGVQARLVAVLKVSGGWEIICGGGDADAVGAAILATVANIAQIIGSTTTARNVTVSLYQNPNTYTVVYVNPPAQVVTIDCTWNTTMSGFTGGPVVNQLAAPALQNYINSIVVGQPINLIEMNDVFLQAVASTLASNNVTTLEYVVTVNGAVVGPTAGTSIIPSDPESYFSASATAITVTQG